MGNKNSLLPETSKQSSSASSSPAVKLSDKKIKYLMDNTGLGKEEIIEWNQQFLVSIQKSMVPQPKKPRF